MNNRHELIHWHICCKCHALVGCVCNVGWFIEDCCAECLEQIMMERSVEK